MILNMTNGKCVAENAFHAVSFFHRLRGLVGRKFDSRMDAMVFASCNAIHTLFRGMAIDVIFLDKENRIVRLLRAEPWRMCYCCPGAVCVVELPAGACEKSSCAVGDFLDLDAENAGEGKIKRAGFEELSQTDINKENITDHK